MFLIIIISLIFLYLLAERYIYNHTLKGYSRKSRIIYLTLSSLGLLPYCIITVIGRFKPLLSPEMATIGTISLVLLMINILGKIPFALGLWGHIKRGRKWPLKVATTLSATAILLLLYGTLWEQHQLRTTEITLYYDNLPDEADGLRIVQIGDIHIGNTNSRHKVLSKVVKEIQQIRPDIIIDCGDMINARYSELSESTMALLSQFTAPLGVYTVMGNHDRGDYLSKGDTITPEENTRLLYERQESMGWRNITDTTTTLHIGNDSLFLTGIGYPADLGIGNHGLGTNEKYAHFFSSQPEGAFNIVIAHSPVMWDNILDATKAELTLSGHVHAMQLRIPIGPRGWSPAALAYKHWSGLYEKSGQRLFVTDGIGGGVPFRVGAKPQIVVITLRKK